jgi:hypothetical protein
MLYKTLVQPNKYEFLSDTNVNHNHIFRCRYCNVNIVEYMIGKIKSIKDKSGVK